MEHIRDETINLIDVETRTTKMKMAKTQIKLSMLMVHLRMTNIDEKYDQN